MRCECPTAPERERVAFKLPSQTNAHWRVAERLSDDQHCYYFALHHRYHQVSVSCEAANFCYASMQDIDKLIPPNPACHFQLRPMTVLSPRRAHAVPAGLNGVPSTLNQIATAAGISPVDIARLNADIAARPKSMPLRKGEPVQIPILAEHVLTKGETLAEVSMQFGVTASAIARINGIEDPKRVPANTTLAIPLQPIDKQLKSAAAELPRNLEKRELELRTSDLSASLVGVYSASAAPLDAPEYVIERAPAGDWNVLEIASMQVDTEGRPIVRAGRVIRGVAAVDATITECSTCLIDQTTREVPTTDAASIQAAPN